MFGRRHAKLIGGQRPLVLLLLPILSFFVGLAFLFHLSVSFSERVLIFSDDDTPVILAQLPAIGSSRFP